MLFIIDYILEGPRKINVQNIEEISDFSKVIPMDDIWYERNCTTLRETGFYYMGEFESPTKRILFDVKNVNRIYNKSNIPDVLLIFSNHIKQYNRSKNINLLIQ